MNRRDFFKFAASAGGILLLPELLSPRRTFFLPPVGGWRRYDYVSIALGYMVTYQDIANNLYAPPQPAAYAIYDKYAAEWEEVFNA